MKLVISLILSLFLAGCDLPYILLRSKEDQNNIEKTEVNYSSEVGFVQLGTKTFEYNSEILLSEVNGSEDIIKVKEGEVIRFRNDTGLSQDFTIGVGGGQVVRLNQGVDYYFTMIEGYNKVKISVNNGSIILKI